MIIQKTNCKKGWRTVMLKIVHRSTCMKKMSHTSPWPAQVLQKHHSSDKTHTMHSVYIVIDENEYNFDEIIFHCDPRLPRCLLQLRNFAMNNVLSLLICYWNHWYQYHSCFRVSLAPLVTSEWLFVLQKPNFENRLHEKWVSQTIFGTSRTPIASSKQHKSTSD